MRAGGEISLDKKLLVKPAATMKSGREHRRAAMSTRGSKMLERRVRVRSDEKVDAAAFVFAGPNGSPAGYTIFALAPQKVKIDACSAA